MGRTKKRQRVGVGTHLPGCSKPGDSEKSEKSQRLMTLGVFFVSAEDLVGSEKMK